ncbi:uncharacterized protein LOC116618646 [Nematostella vectensis]|uniref:uncharacterized protein LOC116618646 n=1 Tax=Nematostella vectensis TaxID=45351 RepID=UPI00138FA965|nr:uncharacterized protein LOC116618646 [Nematostella vectensis]
MADFSPGPVHNAMRRMTELIDLENFESYFDEMLLDSSHSNSNHGKAESKEREFDDISVDLSPQELTVPTDSDSRRRSQAHIVSIKSFTEILYERTEGNKEITKEEPSLARVNTDTKKTEKARENTINVQAKRKKKISTASRVSATSSLEKNAWGRSKRSDERVHPRERQNCCLLVCKTLWGLNKDYKWYSLKGKGICWLVPMVLIYTLICVLLLPFLICAAAVSAVLLCASVCSYLSFAQKKVGVSLDEEKDKTCLEALWWWA